MAAFLDGGLLVGGFRLPVVLCWALGVSFQLGAHERGVVVPALRWNLVLFHTET